MTDLFLGPCSGHSPPNRNGLLQIFQFIFSTKGDGVDKDKRFKLFNLGASCSGHRGEHMTLFCSDSEA